MSSKPPAPLSGISQDATQGPGRTIGLVGATGVGLGAIVGGGILVLAGVAFKTSGPGALVAFLLNGIIAVLTALSFAEMSTRFPESGGAYTFAKRVLSVRSAFAAGWILWFAYIVAGVLYALGFASYAVELIRILFYHNATPAWLQGRTFVVIFALIPTVLYSASLIRQASGGGQWATWGENLRIRGASAGRFLGNGNKRLRNVACQARAVFPRGNERTFPSHGAHIHRTARF